MNVRLKIKNGSSLLGKCFLIIVICAIIGYALLSLAYLLPTEKMQENVKKSASTFEKDRLNNCMLLKNYPTTYLDDLTDALMLTESVTSDGNAFYYEAANSTYLASYTGNPFWALIQYSDGDYENLYNVSYARYWHGYQIFLKPLLLLFDYSQIRIINGIFLVIISLVSLYMIAKKIGIKYSVAYLLSVIFIQPIVLPFSLQNSSVYYVINISVIILCMLKDKSEKYWIAFLMAGILTAYFDLLTYPSASLGVIMVLLVVFISDRKLIEALIEMIKNGIIWLIGYAGMWSMKWLIASIVLKQNIFLDAYNNIVIRTDTRFINILNCPIDKKATLYNRIETPFDFMMEDYLWIIIIGMFVISFILLVICHDIELNRRKKLVLFTATAMIPLIWYLLIVNHSLLHIYFTFRSLITFMFAAFAYEMSIFDMKKYKSYKNSIKNASA